MGGRALINLLQGCGCVISGLGQRLGGRGVALR